MSDVVLPALEKASDVSVLALLLVRRLRRDTIHEEMAEESKRRVSKRLGAKIGGVERRRDVAHSHDRQLDSLANIEDAVEGST